MDVYLIALFVMIITGWGFLRSFLVNTKKIVIPKWFDLSITLIIVLSTIYIVYDTFFVLTS